MGKRIAGFLGVLASIAGILGLLVALNIIHPFPSPPTPTPLPIPGITPTPMPTSGITPTPPTLMVLNMSLNARNTADCPSSYNVGQSFRPLLYTVYTCNEVLSNSGQGSLTWSASGGGLSGVSIAFNRQRGILEPGQSITVTLTITVTGGTCPTIYLYFAQETSPAKTFPVTWSCS